jgi:O-methyltransferase involved in polyketide biosynthesis
MDMDLLLVRETAILIACALAAYTDYKTGFIYDKITYSLMGFGALLLAFDFWQAGNIDWAVLAIPVAVFAGG